MSGVSGGNVKMVCFCKFPGRLILARALARRGDKARNRGAFATAAEMYRLALKHDPTRTDIYVQYGHMSKEIGRYQEAEAAYRCALSRSPGDGETHLQFGHLLKLTGQVEQAFEAFKAAQRLMPDNAIPSAELEPRIWCAAHRARHSLRRVRI
jgi:tetratricopeptide (TPR) repeat protein